MPTDTEFDRQRFDYHVLTSAEWPAIQRRLIQRAHEQRAKAIRELATAVWSWFRRAVLAGAAIAVRELRAYRLAVRRRKAQRADRAFPPPKRREPLAML